MLIVGYCYGIRSERKLCQEVALHLAYRWFCKLDLDDEGEGSVLNVAKGNGHGGSRTRSYERRSRVMPAEQRALTFGMLLKTAR